MNNNKASAEERTIDLTTFATRRTDGSIVIKNIGVFQLKLACKSDSHTRGTINIAGKTLPILSSQHTSLSQNEINEDSCILLLDADPSFSNFKIGIIVDDITQITKIANDFI